MAPRLIIEAGRTDRQYWRDLWRYRELFLFLAWRDLLIRYKQTAVGVTWSIIRPLLTMLALVLAMKVGKLHSGGVPAPLFVFCAMLPWQFFSTALSESGNSLVNNPHLISKVYCPRLVIPASSVITCFVDFLISFGFMALMLAWYHLMPPVNIFFLPFFMLLMFGASFGTGVWLSALMVKYRDFRFIVPFVVQFGLYVVPVIIMTGDVEEKWRLLYSLNPIVGIIDGFRWCLLGGEHRIFVPGLIASVVGVLLLVWSGLWYFRRTERTFADMI
ncbi:MAG: ABC transporter permease [Verrucomicrobiae bacterium]|nr:ABC transporter permease [Verrucomicrobiae bacterium]